VAHSGVVPAERTVTPFEPIRIETGSEVVSIQCSGSPLVWQWLTTIIRGNKGDANPDPYSVVQCLDDHAWLPAEQLTTSLTAVADETNYLRSRRTIPRSSASG
jgi:hypothetical protein